MNNIISKIFVINLEKSIDRKAHIVDEFERIGIKDYEFFKAVDKDSNQVKDLMISNFVKKFPPCFRCGKNKCRCQNNVLIKHQIGNWCSFINLMKKIIENKYNDLIMICEDDIKFADKYKVILDSLININNFKK